MATKKPAPKKSVKALKPTGKLAKKTATKPVAKTSAKKTVPDKVIVKTPVKKVVVIAKTLAKPVSKIPAKKPIPVKPIAKVLAKRVVAAKGISKVLVKKAAVVAKKIVKSIAKLPAKKVASAKVIAKPTAKKVVTKPIVTAKVVAKPVLKPVVIAPPVAKPIITPIKAVAKSKIAVVPLTPAKAVKKALEPIKDVKVGKIIAKTSVPYNPIYTPMEKRPTSVKSNNPLVKYSDNDLNEFRDLINKKLDTAKKELAYLQGLITRKDEVGSDEARYMTMEDGSMSMEREQLSQMASRQITYIDHLEKAIMRIENKTYGICRVTGKLIDKARLRAVPHATLSLEAKLGLVKSGNE